VEYREFRSYIQSKLVKKLVAHDDVYKRTWSNLPHSIALQRCTIRIKAN